MFSLICVGTKGWVNNREAGDLRRYRAHYDVTVMCCEMGPRFHIYIYIVGSSRPWIICIFKRQLSLDGCYWSAKGGPVGGRCFAQNDTQFTTVRIFTGWQWPTTVHPFYDHGDACAFFLPPLSDLWAADLLGYLCATIFEHTCTQNKTTFRPRCDFNSVIVVAQWRHKGRNPCERGIRGELGKFAHVWYCGADEKMRSLKVHHHNTKVSSIDRQIVCFSLRANIFIYPAKQGYDILFT